MLQEYIRQIKEFSTIQPKTALEIGVLDGKYCNILKNKFGLKESDVYLVEPNPELFKHLNIIYPGLNVFNFAISNTESVLDFNQVISSNKNKLGCSSLRKRIDGWNTHLNYSIIKIPAITGKQLLDQIGKAIDLCIIDVEGMSYEVLHSFESKISIIKSLMIECEHIEIFKSQKLFQDVCNILEQNNFKQMAFRYSYANQSDSIWIHNDFVSLSFKK